MRLVEFWGQSKEKNRQRSGKACPIRADRRAGQVLTMDEAAIVDQADRIGRAAWARLFRSKPDLPVPGGFAPAG